MTRTDYEFETEQLRNGWADAERRLVLLRRKLYDLTNDNRELKRQLNTQRCLNYSTNRTHDLPSLVKITSQVDLSGIERGVAKHCTASLGTV